MKSVTEAFFLACCVASVATVTTDQLPPHFVKQPPNRELLFQVAEHVDDIHKPFIIECEANGEPRPEYTWKKNGVNFDWQLYGNRISKQPGRGSLVFISPQDEDRGDYQCFAENEFGIAMSNVVHVRKSVLNSFSAEEPDHRVVSEGDPLGLTCEYPHGYPEPEVDWVIEISGPALRTINSPRMTVDPEGTLWFSNVTRDDASKDDMYVCTAISMFRIEYKIGNRVTLVVNQRNNESDHHVKAPTLQYVSRNVVDAQRGEKAELWCIYGGTPLPEISWTKQGKSLSGDRYTTTNYGKTLVIRNVDFDDEGSYECAASNGVGNGQSRSFDVRVKAKPYFTVIPENIIAAEGEVAEFFCEANGNPKPTVQWFKNGEPLGIENDEHRELEGNMIKITNLVRKDTANYACKASNSLGYVLKNVYLNVLGDEISP